MLLSPSSAEKPVALLVEDDAPTRRKLASRLRKSGFAVTDVAHYDDALSVFRTGFVDVVVADWDLERADDKKGDALFETLRQLDWEVPLVLVSGKLNEDSKKARTLERIMGLGPVRFVERGQGYGKTIAAVRELLARRDMAMRRVIERLREADAKGETIKTTTGTMSPGEILESLLTSQEWKEGTLSPLAEDFAEWEEKKRRKRAARRSS